MSIEGLRLLRDLLRKRFARRKPDFFSVEAQRQTVEGSPSERALQHLTMIVEELITCGLPYDMKQLNNIQIVEGDRGASVEFVDGKVIYEISRSLIEEGHSCLDHEPAHVIHFQLRIDEIREKKPDVLGSQSIPTIEELKSWMLFRGISELYAFLFEEVFKVGDQKTTFARNADEQKLEYPNQRFPAFDMFYNSPSHALGHEVAQRLLQQIPDRESRLKLIVSLIDQPTEVVWQCVNQLFGKEFPILVAKFNAATESFHNEFY